ncbi:GNAT family N-acetyltransferase [Halolamina salifodinae]|uniref:Ribosomal protein S18 acetylase RimI-like enzyme n=1 Tax=Halolamina salifodinae TaxID=1202767 RepID=A0A8T4GZB5_9EURY|nr:N-acetyltransferase [Halolamina salifodinae]MBP1987642.1 ribosomal protein S18 acetylase RimI-like enzyme [Halolamina salifodinae]
MSATVETRRDPRGDATHEARAWERKEQIRREEAILKQRRSFFRDAYRRADCRLLFVDDDLAGFVSTRRDGYILFLAVAPEYRGEGFGERLVADVARDHESVSCHARATNEDALGFYRHLGFETIRRIDGYYEDGGDAYYLKLGQDRSLSEKLSEFVRR